MVKKLRLTLPENPRFLALLKKKIGQYRERMAKMEKNQSPVRTFSTLTGYKAIIAQRLTLRGEVDTAELSNELREEYGFVDYAAFNSAAGVIEDYCKTGGKHVTQEPIRN